MSSLIIQIVDGLKTHRTVISFLKCKHFKGFFPPHQFYVGSLPQQEHNQVQKSANKLQSVIDDIIILEKFLLPLYYHFLYHFSCHLFSLSVFDFFLIAHFHSVNIWYVFCVLLWIKYGLMRFANHHILFLFTICSVQLQLYLDLKTNTNTNKN